MLHLLLLVLLLKQSEGVNEECRELQAEISGLETDITRITEQEYMYVQFFDKCKVSTQMYIYIYIYIYIYTKPCRFEQQIVIVADLKYKTELLFR